MPLPKHILVATDFSEPAGGAVDKAAELAAELGGRVSLLHVFDPTPWVPPVAIPAPSRLEERVEEELSHAFQAKLDEIRSDRLGNVGDVHTGLIKDPSPAHALCNYAADHNVDLIVVGTHGRTGMAHWVIGSVAERVARHAPCAVLTIRPEEAGQ